MNMEEILKNRNEKTDELFAVQPREGIIMKLFKWFWGWKVWRLPYERFILLYFQITHCEDCLDYETADRYIKKAVEVYYLLFGSLLAVLYLTAFYVASNNCSWFFAIRAIVVCLAALISLYRIGEIISACIQLHFFKPYQTSNPSRALVLTMVIYIQTSIAFATTFLAEAFLFNDCYSESIRCHILDSFYFSVVTIATLGYGDLHPQKWPGKFLVITELLVGISLIVVIFQRVVSILKGGTKDDE